MFMVVLFMSSINVKIQGLVLLLFTALSVVVDFITLITFLIAKMYTHES